MFFLCPVFVSCSVIFIYFGDKSQILHADPKEDSVNEPKLQVVLNVRSTDFQHDVDHLGNVLS